MHVLSVGLFKEILLLFFLLVLGWCYYCRCCGEQHAAKGDVLNWLFLIIINLLTNIKISRHMPTHRLRILHPSPRTIFCPTTSPLPSTQRPKLNHIPTQINSSSGCFIGTLPSFPGTHWEPQWNPHRVFIIV